MKPSPYESLASYESALNEEEPLLLAEKHSLSRAVEELRLNRRAVVADRRKVEDEVHRHIYEGNARHRATEQVLRGSEAERRRLETEEKALRQLTEELVGRRVEMEAARKLAEGEVRRSAEAAARTRLQHDVYRPTGLERKRTEEPGSCAVRDGLRLVEPQIRRSQAENQTQEELTLGKRLRAEIDGLAAAQRKQIDASRARLNVLRNTNLAHHSTAA